MRHRLPVTFGLLITALSLFSAADWPQWRGPNQDGVSSETGLADSWPEDGPPVLWRLPISGGFSAVAVSGGIAYTMSALEEGEFVVAIDAEKGGVLWKTRCGDLFENGEYGNGPRATPTIAGGRLYALGGGGSLVCLDAKTGDKHWNFNVVEKVGAKNAEYGASASPVVVDGKLIVVAGESEGKSLVCLNAESGQTIWTALNDRAGYATPLLTEVGGVKFLAVFTAEGVVGVGLENGEEFWRYPWETSMDANVATPICHKDRIFVSTRGNNLTGGAIGCALFQLSVKDGVPKAELVWESRNMKNYFSTSVVVDDYLYGFNATRFTCLDLESADTLWRAGGFNKGSLIAADGKLIVFGERGNLALVEATPEEYREISQFHLFNSLTWIAPTLANGRLYVRDEAELVCLDLRK